MPKIKTLIIRFNTPIKRTEIPLFRGAVIAALPSCNVLFHNHDGDKLRYAYPLIQYKRIGGNASIVCVGKGVESIGELLVLWNNKSLQIGNKEEGFSIENINANQTEVQCWDSSFCYRLRDWLPLNENNHAVYMETNSIIERMKTLERILIGNILSFAKGINLQISKPIKLSIESIENSRTVKYKHIPLECLDITFSCNVSLPLYIGLGKHSSVGFGILTKKANS